MAAKTKFSIDVKFDTRVPVKYVPVKSIQKGVATGKKAAAVTDESFIIPSITVSWEELADPINKMVTLSIKEVSIEILFKCDIQYAREIPRRSQCHTHVVRHENLHVANRRATLNRNKNVIAKYIENATAPKMDKPVTIKLSKAKAQRDTSYKKILTATQDACGKMITLSNDESKKVDTPSEDRRTNGLCAQFL